MMDKNAEPAISLSPDELCATPRADEAWAILLPVAKRYYRSLQTEEMGNRPRGGRLPIQNSPASLHSDHLDPLIRYDTVNAHLALQLFKFNHALAFPSA